MKSWKKFTVAILIIVSTVILAIKGAMSSDVALVFGAVGSMFPVADAAQNAAKAKWGG